MSSLREEFDKDFDDKFGYFKLFSPMDEDPKIVALWAVEWAFNKAQKVAENHSDHVCFTEPQCQNGTACRACFEIQKTAKEILTQ